MIAAADGVAVVGIGCRFPGGADTPERFWRLLCDGVDAIREIPSDRFDLGRVYDPDPGRPGKLYARWGGFLEQIDCFDAAFFGISPREAARIDPQHRLLLELAWEALEDAGLPAERLAGRPVGVFVGISTHDYGDVQMYPSHRLALDAHSNTGTATSIAANRISYMYDFRGPSLTVDTACSSSLTAIHLACQSLQAGECELALVGGAQVLLVPELTIGFCKATMLSPDGRCKAFDASANGYVRSEGSGVVVLKPLAAAVAAGDPIYAVIRGSAVNQDGHTNGMTVPSAAAQAAMVRTALTRAGLSPQEIQYVEAHGTGTPVGDPIEATAIGNALADGRAEGDARCAIGSVKTNIGHLEAAAGMAGLIKTALAIKHRQIPPSLHFKQANPAINFEQLGLRVVTQLEPWPAPRGARAAAGVSSFGFGGSNAHVILQEPPPAVATEGPETEAPQLLTLSARNPDALRALALQYRRILPERSAYDACAAAARNRSHLEHRLGVVGASSDELADGLDAFLNGDSRANVTVGRAGPGAPPRVAFVFSGMGPQWWAMGRQLLASEPVFREMIDRCDELLRPYAGFSLLAELTRDEASSRVGEADLAQMTNFAIQVGLVALWQSWGIRPDAVIGHSAGEMAAAYTSGALDLASTLWLAYHRSRLQSRASGKGRMLAVGLPPDELVELLSTYGGSVGLAAVNSPSSVTLSGDEQALEALLLGLQERQVFARLLPVEVPYHSRHMDPIRDELLESLRRLQPRGGSVPMVSVVGGEWTDGSDLDAQYWWRNVRQPVQFAAGVERLIGDGFTTFLEVGPHPVLGISVSESLAKHGARGTVLGSLRRMEDERASMLRTLSTLHCTGHSVVWEAVYPRAAREQLKLPTYPWQRERHWLDLADSSDEEITIGPGGEHPLLGRRVRTARPLWEASLGDERLAFLDDHLVQGAVVFPGAAYLEMALSGARLVDPSGPPVLRDVSFERALVVNRRADTLVQLGIDADRRRWEVHSRGGDLWIRHAAGSFEVATDPSAESMNVDELELRCQTSVDPDEFYAVLRRRGLDLGGAFHAIRQLQVGDGEALAHIQLTEAADPAPYTLHPALLDASLQSLVGAVLGANLAQDSGGVFLPVHVDRVVLREKTPAVRCIAYARMRSAPGHPPEGDITVVDESGAVCLEVRGLRCQVLGAAAGTGTEGIDDWLYEYRWESKALGASPAVSASVADIELAPMLAGLQAEADVRGKAWDWREYYARNEEQLNALAAHYVVACMAELGWSRQPGETVSTESLADRLAIVPSRHALFQRLLEILAERGLLEPTSTGWQVTDAPPPLAANVDSLLRDSPAYEAEIRLLERCGAALSGVLRGRIDAREVLFAERTLDLVARMYRDSPPSRVYNTLSAETVGRLADAAAADRPLRVLEIGAGTGGTTAYVVPRLATTGAEYTFTDISPRFADRARAEFGTDTRFVARSLDIESDPQAQGFAANAYDVVLASNVLHATADLSVTMAHVNRLVAPGGVLVLQEITRHPYWLDLIFGLTDGWWRFTDRDVRPSHPLLTEQQWARVLESAGFQEIGVMGDVLPTGNSAQAVIVGRARTATAQHWLIVGSHPDVRERVAAAFVKHGRSCTLSSTADLEADLDRLGTVRGIIYLAHAEHASEVFDASVDSCVDLVSILQSVARQERLACDLVIVTTGAQPCGEHDDNLSLSTSPLWGLARVAMREQAQPRCRLVDLDPEANDDQWLDELLRELVAESTEHEEEVAFRGGVRHIRRLRRAPLSDVESTTSSEPRVADEPFAVQIRTPGALETLEITRTTRRAPGPGEVEIEVHAASLNFRDVMLAMGLLSPLATDGTFGGSALGIDCAGIVSACGADVEDLQPGDAVLGIGAGALASHVTTSAKLVARRPAALAPQPASTMLCAFVTAEYALLHLARLQPGERVLIHSATGGVGLAALQVAQAIGAEIFATAGSPDKRAYLASLGVRHVMDSRSLQFADDILEQTNGEGVDVVLNSLTGAAIEKGLAVLRPYGRFVEIGKRDIYANSTVGLLAFRKNQSFIALDLDRLCAERPELVGSLIRDVVAKVDGGVYQPLLHTVFPISDVEEAVRHMAQARHMGKVVLALDDAEVQVRGPARTGPLFRADATYLISGGLGGFGVATAEWMARQGAGTLVLVGRGEPGPDATAGLERVRAAGARVEVRRADVTDSGAVRQLLAALRTELPPLRGIVHAAMVLDDGPIQQLDRDRLARVMAPKLAGAWNLHQLTLDDPLECFVLFSSIASLLGNPLQANYAAGNAFFGPLAHVRRAQGRPALCVDWGVLSGVGYLATRQEVADHLARQGYLSFDAEQALGVLAHLLRTNATHLMAARMDWGTWARSSPTAATAPKLLDFAVNDDASWSGDAGERQSLRTTLLLAGVAERREQLVAFLRERVARILGIAPARLDPQTALPDLGFDSLMAVELSTVVTMELGVELAVVKLLQGLSIEGLADLVLHILDLPDAPPPQAAPVAPPVVVEPAPIAEVQTTPINTSTNYSALDYTSWSPRQRAAKSLFALGWRMLTDLHVDGIENLPADGAYLIAANHISYLDAPLVMTVLPRRTIVFAGERLRDSRVFNWFLSDLANAIYIRRGAGDVEALERGLAVLQAGGVLGVGPEGGISPGGALGTGHTGIAYLATRADVPVIPIAAWGQEHVRGEWRRLRRPPVHVRIGAPLRFPAGDADGTQLRAYTDQVMSAIAGLLPPTYRGLYATPESTA